MILTVLSSIGSRVGAQTIVVGIGLMICGAPEDLRLVIMRNTLSGEDHAVVAARFEGHWRLLDNRHLVMLEDMQVRRYHPIFVIDEHEVRRFADPPIVKANKLAVAGPSSQGPGIAADRASF